MARVLVTRPQPAAQRTAAKLVALAHQPVLLPLAEARHDVAAALDGLRLDPASIALTSAEAVRVLAGLGEDLSPHLETPVFAVGSATAAAAHAVGFKHVLVGPGDGEGLGGAVIKHAATPLLYLAGTPRSAAFEEALKRTGMPVIVRECYRMSDIEHSPEVLAAVFGQDPLDAVLLYSPESARRFFDLPDVRDKPERLRQTEFLCISHAVARVVPGSFSAAISISEKPEETSLLALL